MSEHGDLERFLKIQAEWYPVVLGELQKGKKKLHWMWFIFPQHIALASSDVSHFYGLSSLEHARSYLEHEVLGERLRALVSLLLSHLQGEGQDQGGKGLVYVLPKEVDRLKLKSSLTLFERAATSRDDQALFSEALELLYRGARCEETLEALRVD